MKLKSIREIKSKMGASNPKPTIPIGTMCQITFYKDTIDMMKIEATIDGQLVEWKVPVCQGIFRFKNSPSIKCLENWILDEGICKSVTGHKVEPDGYGPDGSPSWLLVLNMI